MVVGRRPARLAIRLRGASLPRARTDSHSTLPWTGRRHAISGAPPTIWPAGVLTGPLEGPHAKGTAAVCAYSTARPTLASPPQRPTLTAWSLREISQQQRKRWKRSGQLRANFCGAPFPLLPVSLLHTSLHPPAPLTGIVLVQFRPGALVCVMRPKAPPARRLPSSQPRPKRRWRIGRDHMRAVRTDHLL